MPDLYELDTSYDDSPSPYKALSPRPPKRLYDNKTWPAKSSGALPSLKDIAGAIRTFGGECSGFDHAYHAYASRFQFLPPASAAAVSAAVISGDEETIDAVLTSLAVREHHRKPVKLLLYAFACAWTPDDDVPPMSPRPSTLRGGGKVSALNLTDVSSPAPLGSRSARLPGDSEPSTPVSAGGGNRALQKMLAKATGEASVSALSVASSAREDRAAAAASPRARRARHTNSADSNGRMRDHGYSISGKIRTPGRRKKERKGLFHGQNGQGIGRTLDPSISGGPSLGAAHAMTMCRMPTPAEVLDAVAQGAVAGDKSASTSFAKKANAALAGLLPLVSINKHAEFREELGDEDFSWRRTCVAMIAGDGGAYEAGENTGGASFEARSDATSCLQYCFGLANDLRRVGFVEERAHQHAWNMNRFYCRAMAYVADLDAGKEKRAVREKDVSARGFALTSPTGDGGGGGGGGAAGTASKKLFEEIQAAEADDDKELTHRPIGQKTPKLDPKIVRKMHITIKNQTYQEKGDLSKLFARFDDDGSGHMQFQEFFEWLNGQMAGGGLQLELPRKTGLVVYRLFGGNDRMGSADPGLSLEVLHHFIEQGPAMLGPEYATHSKHKPLAPLTEAQVQERRATALRKASAAVAAIGALVASAHTSTIAHVAALNDRNESLSLLLLSGCDIHLRDSTGRSVHETACEAQALRCGSLLFAAAHDEDGLVNSMGTFGEDEDCGGVPLHEQKGLGGRVLHGETTDPGLLRVDDRVRLLPAFYAPKTAAEKVRWMSAVVTRMCEDGTVEVAPAGEDPAESELKVAPPNAVLTESQYSMHADPTSPGTRWQAGLDMKQLLCQLVDAGARAPHRRKFLPTLHRRCGFFLPTFCVAACESLPQPTSSPGGTPVRAQPPPGGVRLYAYGDLPDDAVVLFVSYARSPPIDVGALDKDPDGLELCAQTLRACEFIAARDKVPLARMYVFIEEACVFNTEETSRRAAFTALPAWVGCCDYFVAVETSFYRTDARCRLEAKLGLRLSQPPFIDNDGHSHPVWQRLVVDGTPEDGGYGECSFETVHHYDQPCEGPAIEGTFGNEDDREPTILLEAILDSNFRRFANPRHVHLGMHTDIGTDTPPDLVAVQIRQSNLAMKMARKRAMDTMFKGNAHT